MDRRQWESAVSRQFESWERGKNRAFFEERFAQVLRFARPGTSILDVGCGDGEMLARLSKLARPRAAAGLELSAELVERARRRKREKMKFSVGSAQAIPYPSSSFDLVYCTAVLEHAYEPLKAIDEIARVVRPGGVAVITTPNPLYSLLAKLSALLGLKYPEGLERHLLLGDVAGRLQSRGFDIIESRGFVPFTKPRLLISVLEPFGFAVAGLTLLPNQLVVARKP